MPQVYIGEDIVSGDGLTTGDEIVTRSAALAGSNAAVTGTNQLLLLNYFTARKMITSTQVRVATGTTAAGATPTLCRLGLYTLTTPAGAGLTGTLVASTVNDTTLFAAASTAYTRSWAASIAMQPGQRYALGILVVTGAAAPTFAGQLYTNTAEANLAPRLCAQLAAQADLPATFLDTSLASAAGRAYGVILP